MGKKGKGKKEKITGTPEVIKFKSTKEFQLLKECVALAASLPFVASEVLDQVSFKKVGRFLNMLGLLSEFLKADTSKEYRFKFHHQLVAPPPQYFPIGYPASLITVARQISQSTQLKFNEKDYDYNTIAPNLQAQCEEFLKDLDASMTVLGAAIEDELKLDFPQGLKKFNADMGARFAEFDKKWVAFESAYLEAKFQIDSDVLSSASKLVEIEKKLTDAEDRIDIPDKQFYENEFITEVEEIVSSYHKYIGVEKKKFYNDVLPLAEACIFYESKCTPEWLYQSKCVIKDYLELRIYVSNLPTTRLQLEFEKNGNFIRLLRKLHGSILAADEALAFIDQLPKLLYNKKEKWMTRALLEPDLINLKKIAT